MLVFSFLSSSSLTRHHHLHVCSCSPFIFTLFLLFSFFIPSCVSPPSNVTTVRTLCRCPCGYTTRRFDGFCTSGNHNWARAGSPQRIIPGTWKCHRPSLLPSPRRTSLLLFRSHRHDTKRRVHLSQFSVFFSQFIDHDISHTPQNRRRPSPIPVPRSDIFFKTKGIHMLPFFKSRLHARRKRPINSVSGALDLSQIYGSSLTTMRNLRKGPYLRHSNHDLLPIRGKLFLSGDSRVNEHPMLTAIHTVFSREHNSIVDLLKISFPFWNSKRLFSVARSINIAQYQRIVYEEFLPSFLNGYRIAPTYKGFSPKLDPSPSLIFSTAAFRIGHTMIPSEIFINVNKRKFKKIDIKEMFFSSPWTFHTVERHLLPILNNIAPNPCPLCMAKSLRNGLFIRSKSKRIQGLDLASNNIARGRDHCLPTLNQMRLILGLKPYDKMNQITKERNVIKRLEQTYDGNVNVVELWPGLLAEERKGGEFLGRTAKKIWIKEFERFMTADRWFYKRSTAYMNGVGGTQTWRKRMTMRGVLTRNLRADVTSQIPRDVWRIKRS